VQQNNATNTKNIIIAPIIINNQKKIKEETKKKGEDIIDNFSLTSTYELRLSDNLLVKANFPKIENDVKKREFLIRNKMQMIFEDIYKVDAKTAMIMANMNRKDITTFCDDYGITAKEYLKAKELYDSISWKSIEFNMLDESDMAKFDGKEGKNIIK